MRPSSTAWRSHDPPIGPIHARLDGLTMRDNDDVILTVANMIAAFRETHGRDPEAIEMGKNVYWSMLSQRNHSLRSRGYPGVQEIMRIAHVPIRSTDDPDALRVA